VRSPAGLPLGADGQEGIALSIMAEISSLRAKLRPSFIAESEREPPEQPGEAVDPVCGMPVESALHVVEHGGRRYRFCSSGCKRAFEKEPEKYATEVSAR
jgi:xanthine dehydrogenase accessory factor